MTKRAATENHDLLATHRTIHRTEPSIGALPTLSHSPGGYPVRRHVTPMFQHLRSSDHTRGHATGAPRSLLLALLLWASIAPSPALAWHLRSVSEACGQPFGEWADIHVLAGTISADSIGVEGGFRGEDVHCPSVLPCTAEHASPIGSAHASAVATTYGTTFARQVTAAVSTNGADDCMGVAVAVSEHWDVLEVQRDEGDPPHCELRVSWQLASPPNLFLDCRSHYGISQAVFGMKWDCPLDGPWGFSAEAGPGALSTAEGDSIFSTTLQDGSPIVLSAYVASQLSTPGDSGSTTLSVSIELRDPTSSVDSPVTTVDNGPRAIPNPSAGPTAINFALAEPGWTSVRIFDATGRLVRVLSVGEMTVGAHSIMWNGRSDTGALAPIGVYFTRVQTGSRVVSGRVVKR